MAEPIKDERAFKDRCQAMMETLHELRRYARKQMELSDIEPFWRNHYVDQHRRLNAGMIALDDRWEEQKALRDEKDAERMLAKMEQETGTKYPGAHHHPEVWKEGK